jgi:carboxymethylenebutenolidase
VEKLRAKLGESTQPWKVNIYPGAGHAFFNDSRPSYVQAAALDAGTETLSFLKKYLQPVSA